MTEATEVAAHLTRLFDKQLAGVAAERAAAPDAARVGHSDGIERIPVRVSILVGDQAHVITPGGTEYIPVAILTEATGIPAARLPGRTITALVSGGELTGFAPE